MKKTETFRHLHAKVLIYMKRGTKIDKGKEKDMQDYIEKSHYYNDLLDDLAAEITKKWKLYD